MLSNLEAVGSCLPFIEKTESLEAGVCRWFVRSPMSSITRTSFIDVTIKSQTPTTTLSLAGKGEHLKIGIEFLLNSALPTQTNVVIKAEITATGLLGKVLAPMISTQIDAQMEAFAQNLKENM